MILREFLKSKIHQATISKTELYYKGSIGIDKAIIKKSNIALYEKVHVLNLNNGERIETYVIEEKENSGLIILYGPAARRGQIGDKLCILAYALVSEDDLDKIKPSIVLLDENNKIIKSK
ncbi:MAG: aspartate 1-decarboxylase [bacterium]